VPTDSAVPWGYLPPGMAAQVRRQMDWERYLAEAKALGYSEREARIAAAAIYQIARKIPHEVNILKEAREVLRAAIQQTGRTTDQDPDLLDGGEPAWYADAVDEATRLENPR
jgi:hypothetical protein